MIYPSLLYLIVANFNFISFAVELTACCNSLDISVPSTRTFTKTQTELTHEESSRYSFISQTLLSNWFDFLTQTRIHCTPQQILSFPWQQSKLGSIKRRLLRSAHIALLGWLFDLLHGTRSLLDTISSTCLTTAYINMIRTITIYYFISQGNHNTCTVTSPYLIITVVSQ